MTRQINPMLAQKKDVHKLGLWDSTDWCVQEKFDGERIIYQINTEAPVLTGRRISKKTGKLSEKQDHVPHLILPERALHVFHGTTLDGELIHPKYHEDIAEGFRLLSSVMRSLPELAIEKQKETGFLEYHVYDILEYKGEDLRNKPYKERVEYLMKFFHQYIAVIPGEHDLIKNVYIRRVPTAYALSEKENLYNRVLADGKEGVMLRDLNAPYEEGKKSHRLIKLKEEAEIDAVVTGFEPAKMDYTGKEADTWNLWAMELEPGLWTKEDTKVSPLTPKQLKDAGYIPVSYTWFYNLPGGVNFACYKEGQLVDRGTCNGFNYETAFDMRDNPKDWIGQAIEVRCNGFYPSGKLRHPQYSRKRFDKNPEDCLWE
jgi:ATP-dependent DNA ligase